MARIKLRNILVFSKVIYVFVLSVGDLVSVSLKGVQYAFKGVILGTRTTGLTI